MLVPSITFTYILCLLFFFSTPLSSLLSAYQFQLLNILNLSVSWVWCANLPRIHCETAMVGYCWYVPWFWSTLMPHKIDIIFLYERLAFNKKVFCNLHKEKLGNQSNHKTLDLQWWLWTYGIGQTMFGLTCGSYYKRQATSYIAWMSRTWRLNSTVT